MLRILAVVERWALGVWVGSLAGFAFAFAPAAFARLSGDLDRFAAIVGASLAALAVFGYACGGAALLCALVDARVRRSRAALVRAGCVALMLLLVGYSQTAVVPAMVRTQASFHAPFDAVPPSDPRRVRYDALHAESSRVYGAVLVLGLGALALAP